MSDHEQFRATVRGHVQGVCFRSCTVDEARLLGLAGYARNLDDGSVEVIARGPREDLARLLDFLHRGPSVARVAAVEIEWDDQSAAPSPFDIRF
jgi:acylphosphatase